MISFPENTETRMTTDLSQAPSETGGLQSSLARVSTKTRAHKQPWHLRPNKTGKDAMLKNSSSLGVIPRVLPSIETPHQKSPNPIVPAIVRQVLGQVSRGQLSIGQAHGTIARVWTRSHTQTFGNDDLRSRAGITTYKNQAVQTEPVKSSHCSRDLNSKNNWSINTKATNDSGYLSWCGPSDIRDEDPGSSYEPVIYHGSGRRDVLRKTSNFRDIPTDTHRLQVSSRGNINANTLLLPGTNCENDPRSSFFSQQRLSSSSKEKNVKSTACTRSSTGTESSSDSSPSLSNSSEDNLPEAILANCATQQIAKDVTRHFMEIVRSRFGPRQRGPSSSQEQSQTQSSAQASRPSQYIGREAPQRGRQSFSNDHKRRRLSNGEEEDSDRAPNDKTPGSKRRKIAEADKPKIACPFMKHSPNEFSNVLEWRTCIGPGFDGMNRMKEHLKRKHFRDHTCQRCGVQFSSHATLQDHLRALKPCHLAHAQHQKGLLTSVQWADIQAKRGRSSVEERWKEIYLIIFPKAQEESIPSPYFETFGVFNNLAAQLNPEELDVYLKTHLPSRVLARLKEELNVFSEMVQQKLATVVQEESTETLKAYMRQKGSDQLGSSESPDVAPGGTETNDFSVDEMLKMFSGGETFDFDLPTSWKEWQFDIS